MSETTVTVYSKPACVQCTATKRALNNQGIRYEEIDLTTHDAALEYVTEDLGYSQAPVVVADDHNHNHWSGFRPDLISKLT